MDPELLGLTYIKGASTDSGIDTAPCMPAAVLGPVHLAGGRAVIHSRAEQWGDPADLPGPDGEAAKMYAVHGYAPAGSAADGSVGDLSEISSHSRSVPLCHWPAPARGPIRSCWGRGGAPGWEGRVPARWAGPLRARPCDFRGRAHVSGPTVKCAPREVTRVGCRYPSL